MLTGVRVSELLQARWEEFDLEGRKWDIPEERMKNRLSCTVDGHDDC
jgi:integrase